MKKLLLSLVLLVVLSGAALAFASTAPAHVKTWHRVISMDGGSDTYTDQYLSRSFRLYGGRLKLEAKAEPHVDHEFPESVHWYGADFYVEQVRLSYIYFWGQLSDESGTEPGVWYWWKFTLPRGRYHVDPITYGCDWSYTLYEKR